METRRDFIKKTSAITALSIFSGWAATGATSDKLGKVLPMRQIIRNGEKTTAFGMGGFHAGIIMGKNGH